MKYKELYVDLAETLTSLKCYVCDQDLWGYCFQTESIRAFIVIKSNATFKEKYMTLCHEAGHLFTMEKGKFKWSKKPRSEEEANRFAIDLLRTNDIEDYEYFKVYKKIEKKTKKRILSWFEI